MTTCALAIHGGAGPILAQISEESRRQRFESSLGRILDGGFEMLARGVTSLDTVTAVVRMLEDDPLFNAGHGSSLAGDGSAQLDAAIMDGRNQSAGAVTAVRHVKNPVELARLVMENSPHVMLAGAGAEEFALQQGLALVPNRYFHTAERLQDLERVRSDRSTCAASSLPQGTVGAVALDARGNLAAATSTGGTTNKLPGRVGDSPIIGAGTYAKNGVCAVSTTGYGEYFIRAVAAHHIAAAIEYRGLSVTEATGELIHVILPKIGGSGGVIAVDGAGNMAMEFNTQGMYRGQRDSQGRRRVAVTR